MSEARSPADLLQPGRSILVVVDVQNDYCHPDGALGKGGLDLSMVDPMCAVIEELRQTAGRSGVPTVLLRTIHADATDSPAWLRRTPYSGHICREGSWGAEFYRIQPSDDDVVVTKHRYSGFVGTRLEQVLHTLGRTTLVFTGTSTEVCVESTARDACMRDFDVVVVEDGVASTDEELHRGTLENVRRYFGSVVASDVVRSTWTLKAGRDEGAAA